LAAVDKAPEVFDEMPKSKASEATQELEALKLDMEHVNTRTEEIGQKLDGFKGKFSTLSEQMGRLELLLSQSTGRNVVLEEERRRAAQVAVATAATEALAVASANAAAAQGAGPSQPEAHDEPRGTRGHSQPPHWRRRPDMDQPRHELGHTEQQNKNQRQSGYVDVDQYYEQHHMEDEQYQSYTQQYPPYNPNPYPYPEIYPQWNQYPQHHAHPTYHVPVNPDPYNPPNEGTDIKNRTEMPSSTNP
jgi:hypothetical protein